MFLTDIALLVTISEKLTQPQYARKWMIIWETWSHCDRIVTVSKLKLHKSLEDIPKRFMCTILT